MGNSEHLASEKKGDPLDVLLVEDDEDDYEIVRRLLSRVEDQPIRLAWVTTYEAALEAMARNAYDVYLVDYRLGARDGLTLLREGVHRGCRAPIILLTGQGGHRVDVEAMKAGAADYLAKDQIDASLLERSIRYAVERMRSLETLRKSEERLRLIVEATPVPLIIARLSDQIVLYANDRAAVLLGVSRADMIDKPLCTSMRIEDIQVLDELKEKPSFHRSNVHGERVDGTSFWINLSVEEIAFEGVSAALVGMVDISEQKRAEQALVRMERLRALGEMSAGISHNLNNLLVGVLGPAQAIQRKVTHPQVSEMAQDIVVSARRARDLVQRLHRAVQNREEEGFQPVQIDRLVHEVIRAARPRWKDEAEARGVRIEVVSEIGRDVPPVRGTPSGLHDIFLNLIFNAVDAMPEGGRITFCASARDGAVHIRVCDTGTGMDEKTRLRAFDPFFTTKMAVGSGLGLYTVYGTVNRFGGQIEIESAPGKGTCFALWMPMWMEPEVEVKKPRHMRPSRRGKILVVDDDASVLKILPYLIAEQHEVYTAHSAREALELFGANLYDAALIDLGMPDLPGDRVALKMKQMDPCIATVLITGWEIEDSDPRAAAFDLRLQKPFDDLDDVGHALARAVELRDARVQARDKSAMSHTKDGSYAT